MNSHSLLKQFFRQPSGLYLLAFGELWERLTYYGTQTILVLYLTKIFHFSDDTSYALYGAYAVFAYSMPVLGGTLADRLLGIRQSIIIGALLLIAGNLLLVVQQPGYFYLGLALSVCGTGFYKPNSTSLVGTLYNREDQQQETGFTLFYIGMNIGATLGPLFYGLAALFNWSYGFIFSALGILLSLIAFLRCSNPTLGKAPHPALLQKKIFLNLTLRPFLLLSIAACCVLISVLFSYPTLMGSLLILFASGILLILILYALKRDALERKQIFAVLIALSFVIFFFSASLQVGSSINLFINRDVNKIIFGWNIPTLFFSSLYPFFVILTAPLLAMLWQYFAKHQKPISVANKLFFSLVAISLAFVCFNLATLSNYNSLYHGSLWWIVVGNLLLGIGEACLMPALLTAVNQAAPANLRSTMMGVLFLFIAVSGYLSGVIAKFSSHDSSNILAVSRNIYGVMFLKISAFTALVAIFLWLITPWLNRMLQK